MDYPKVCLRRGEETGVRAGKPWIFENQLDWADDVCKDGGIVDVLDVLLARGWVLGVATGKSDRGLARVLADHGIADRFVTLQTADRHPSKPDPAMLLAAMRDTGATETAMIGDTSFDMLMARAAGTHAIGVAWGYHTRHDLLEAGAAHVADHADALPAHLESL